jgi:hypothetical protein
MYAKSRVRQEGSPDPIRIRKCWIRREHITDTRGPVPHRPRYSARLRCIAWRLRYIAWTCMERVFFNLTVWPSKIEMKKTRAPCKSRRCSVGVRRCSVGVRRCSVGVRYSAGRRGTVPRVSGILVINRNKTKKLHWKY